MSHSPDSTESKIGKVLLIGVTGGTGGNVVKGFLEQGVTDLRAITRKIDLICNDFMTIAPRVHTFIFSNENRYKSHTKTGNGEGTRCSSCANSRRTTVKSSTYARSQIEHHVYNGIRSFHLVELTTW